MHFSLKTVLLQVGLWALAFAVLYTYRWSYSYQWPPSKVFIPLIDLMVLLLCSLTINRLLVPRLLYRKKTVQFVLSLLGLLMAAGQCIHWLQFAWFTFISPGQDPYLEALKKFIFQLFNVYLVTLFGCLCILSFRIIRDYWISVRRFESLQRENAQTELKFLKAQINPHFLFNSINSIYAEIDKTNLSARNQVLKFSDMLRYQLYECATDQIPVEQEIEYLKNYVEFQRNRKESNLNLRFILEGDLTGFTLAPLLFIPFIENAFKYTSTHETEANEVRISLRHVENILVFQCFNTKDPVQSRKLFEDGGIGINNVRRRLELLYPGKHEIRLLDGSNNYEVHLSIHIA